MSERLSTEERERIAQAMLAGDGCYEDEGCCRDSLHDAATAVEAILTARLADRAARLASVEALAHGSELMSATELRQRIRAALHPDPSEPT